jgi:lysophospholipase L1-like esterase
VYAGTEVPANAEIVDPRISSWLLRRSALFRRLEGAVEARVQAKGGNQFDVRWYGKQVDRVLAWEKAHHVPVVVLAMAPHVLADPASCPANFPGKEMCDTSLDQFRKIGGALDERGVRWTDGLAALQASGRPHFHPADHRDPDHPNEDGHRLLAEAVRPAVAAALQR